MVKAGRDTTLRLLALTSRPGGRSAPSLSDVDRPTAHAPSDVPHTCCGRQGSGALPPSLPHSAICGAWVERPPGQCAARRSDSFALGLRSVSCFNSAATRYRWTSLPVVQQTRAALRGSRGASGVEHRHQVKIQWQPDRAAIRAAARRAAQRPLENQTNNWSSYESSGGLLASRFVLSGVNRCHGPF